VNLFNAYVGKHFTVSSEDDARWAEAYPLVNREMEYMFIECWLAEHQNRRGTVRFVSGWLKKAQRDYLAYSKEARVGSFDPGPVRIKAAALERIRKRGSK
jgi:hypothetical protein